MSLASGSKAISTLYLGSNELDKAYLGSDLLYEKAIVYPVKGDLITLAGSQYRVLKIDSNNVAEVLSMTNFGSSSSFNTDNNNTYADSILDTYVQTFYDTLSTDVQNAIIDKTFTQDIWYYNDSGNPIYKGTSSRNYVISKSSSTLGDTITRHCYCISVQDIIDYLKVTDKMSYDNTTLSSANILKMFWNRTNIITEYPWLCSARAELPSDVFIINGGDGCLGSDGVRMINTVRPAFQIDLSKVDFTISN